MLLGVHAQQIFVGRKARLDYCPAALLEGGGNRLQHFSALGSLGMTSRRDVIGESL
jgi:hypothetical protein